MVSTDYRGYVQLPSGGNGNTVNNYYDDFYTELPSFSTSESGPVSKDYLSIDKFDILTSVTNSQLLFQRTISVAGTGQCN